MEKLHQFINLGNNLIWGNILIYLLIGTGIYFTIRTGLLQLRLLPQGWRQMLRRGDTDRSNISPFQAFATGLASRVGTGNIAGVAIAVTIGGPGAVFWMWMTALLGMASAFAESSLAQLFKVNHHDNTYRGGPAYFIEKGLGQRWLGILFALCLILAFAFVFNAVQANSITAATEAAWGWNKYIVGAVLVVMTAPIICGGVRSAARFAALIVPFMAMLYIGITLYIIATNLSAVPGVLKLIIENAFGINQAAGGLTGYAISQAMMHGIRRGLCSNEAGMGSAPNAAATATTRHPATQGIMQMFGVFIDTIIICSCTAAIILIAGVHDSELTGVQLTQKALEMEIGSWGADFLAVAMFLFAFSSIIGNYAYAEGNVEFIKKHPLILPAFRLLVLGMVFFGAVGSLPLVWDMADLSMGLMALINLLAILLLSKYVLLIQRDYEKQLKAGVEQPVFDVTQYPELEKKIYPDVWR